MKFFLRSPLLASWVRMIRTWSPHPPLSLRGGKSQGICSFLHSVMILVDTVIGSSYLLKSEEEISLIWNRYFTRLHEGGFTFWNCWTVRWGWWEMQRRREWQVFLPWVYGVVLLEIIFFVIDEAEWVEQFFAESGCIFASGFEFLGGGGGTTGAYSLI